MRKLAKSFFWIDQELVRSGVWTKLPGVTRLVYIALAASVNRDGVSLWGQEKLIALAGCSTEDWEASLVNLSKYCLVQLPGADEIGISLLSLDQQEFRPVAKTTADSNNHGNKIVFESRGPLVLKTVTTVEFGGLNVESKDSK
jgi:hypothetical protein